ncbi:hypothetical protein ABXT70_04690 [Candidatus Njordibacter sp. Uisw_039]|jgi:acetyl-CoA acetyltransferase|uniref:hypothetical protein n=1 Tax=Candidatus Njordibacter sp. Uisw_039 TaxID=3230972 RepID=UPI003D4EAF8F|tara:strand:+ start:1035 stop:1229 length:195 start_codon:yes stop_codon:yes gene_type:complete
MREVVITSGVRTAIGDFGGALSTISPCDLAISVTSLSMVMSSFSVKAMDIVVMVLSLVIDNVQI